MDQANRFSNLLISHWDEAEKARLVPKNDIVINGQNLGLGLVVTVARYAALNIKLDEDACGRIPAGAEAIRSSLARGLIIYGVNTGFGGNADTRVSSSGVGDLQRCLTRGKHCGVLDVRQQQQTTGRSTVLLLPAGSSGGSSSGDAAAPLLDYTSAIPLDFPDATTCMPESWVRAAMLIRLNSLIRGASGVQVATVETLAQLLNRDVVPLMPLRGSISASGDLSPLSYIAGVMQGKPTLAVFAGSREKGSREIVRADQALAGAEITPVVLGPKEGLAIINGTAVSAAVASLALHESLCLAALSQVLTAMSVEAFLGTDESFHSFISSVRPHPGQVDSASCILSFLRGSRLSRHNDGGGAVLRQDRYSLRTASQWIGPVLEDFSLAHAQLSTEVNSATDNPLVDPTSGNVLHGGNFQARAVTSAVEKLRQGLQTLGRMLFQQSAELFNPTTNRGLPPNLVVDEPSGSYLWKGIDILVASAAAELGFLANPVGSHVMNAELGNQGINSVALISARYTMTAVECLSQLCAAHLLVLCQALDLRAVQARFVEAYFGGSYGPNTATRTSSSSSSSGSGIGSPDFFLRDLQSPTQGSFGLLFDECLGRFLPGNSEAERRLRADIKSECAALFLKAVDKHRTLDSEALFAQAADSLVPLLLRRVPSLIVTMNEGAGHTTPTIHPAIPVMGFARELASGAQACFVAVVAAYRSDIDIDSDSDATPYLGGASRRMYVFVRKVLGVPFLGEDEVMTPKSEEMVGIDDADQGQGKQFPGTALGGMPPTVGSYLTTIYRAIRSGELYGQVVGCFKDMQTDGAAGGSVVANGEVVTCDANGQAV